MPKNMHGAVGDEDSQYLKKLSSTKASSRFHARFHLSPLANPQKDAQPSKEAKEQSGNVLKMFYYSELESSQ